MVDSPIGNGDRIENKKFGRRGFLSGLAGAVGFSPNFVKSSRKTVDIPAYVSRGEVVGYSTVDAEWWEYSKQTEKIYQSFIKKVEKIPGVVMVEKTATENEFFDTGYRRDSFTVYTDSEARISSVQNRVPSRFENRLVEIRSNPELQNTDYENEYDPIPGGVIGEYTSGNPATFCCRVEYDGDYKGILPRHMFTDGDRCDPAPIDALGVTQSGEYVGTTDEGWQTLDVAVVGVNHFASKISDFNNKIVDQSGEIAGYMHPDRIQELKNTYNPKIIQKRGITTGARTGDVTGTGGKILCPEDEDAGPLEELVRTSHSQFPGDSGGPRYEVIDSPYGKHLFILGPATQEHFSGDAEGVPAWYINQETGMVFGP